MFKINTYDNISIKGLEKFNLADYQISTDETHPDAILVRSSKLHDISFPDSVQVVGRAGAGVNNIPIDVLTKKGIPVLNTPGANANAVKELVIAGILIASRNLNSALAYTQTLQGDQISINQQVEKNKKQFVGTELPGKTLGVIGLGSIGVQVANTATHLGMQVIGYDPKISVNNAWQLDASVIQANSLSEVLSQSDFLTIHVPLNENTKHMIDASLLQSTKPGITLLNFSRAEIVDVAAIIKAIENNQIKHYVNDFPNVQLQDYPQVISLPHLGASTIEAQDNCAIMVCEQIKNFLQNGNIHNSVNFPNIQMGNVSKHRITIVNNNIPNMVAQISNVISKFDLNIVDMINKSRNDIAYTLVDVDRQITDQCFNQLSSLAGIIKIRKLHAA